MGAGFHDSDSAEVILRNRVTQDLLFCDCQTARKKQILRLRLRVTFWHILSTGKRFMHGRNTKSTMCADAQIVCKISMDLSFVRADDILS
jgi:hypothetical protein